jgi:hypothetical protein
MSRKTMEYSLKRERVNGGEIRDLGAQGRNRWERRGRLSLVAAAEGSADHSLMNARLFIYYLLFIIYYFFKDRVIILPL